MTERGIARINIAHYRLTLAVEQDETRRQTLRRLLAKEQAALAAIGSALTESKDQGTPFPLGLRDNDRRCFVSVCWGGMPVAEAVSFCGQLCAARS